jgi:hypothetical protein
MGFAKIAGGKPSSVNALVDHLDNQTLKPDMARAAAYYQKGAIERDDQMRAAVIAWRSGDAAPDLVRLADYSVMPGAHLDAHEIRQALSAQYDVAIAEAERIAQGRPELTAEARALHGLPEPPPVAAHLQGLAVAELEARGERTLEQWDIASESAAYRADVLDTIGVDPKSIAVVRPDLHPAVAIGLGIDTTQPLTNDQVAGLIAGRKADGSHIDGKIYAKERETTDANTGERKISVPIGSYDFCPTPDKSVSVAWAMAPEAERAQIINAHLEAAREAVAYIATGVGVARTGKGGQGESEKGHVAWLEFTHHTSRPVIVSVEQGEAKVEDREVRGDMNVHTHFLIPNAVFCDSGRVGSLDTAAIRGLIFEGDGVYQARLAQRLRDAGFEAVLDEKTGAARMPIVPDEVRTLFSKRTNIGEALARQYTADHGEKWDELTDDQRQDRIKAATQSRDQKVKGGKDDVADFEDWKRQAKNIGWEPPQSMQLYGPPLPEPELEARHRLAYETALPWLSQRLEHSAVLTHHEIRSAALRGLVAAGMDGLADVDAVTKIMRAEGVSQYGDKTPLVWGQETDKRHISVTTGLHEENEREFVRLAKEAAADMSASVPTDLLQRSIERSGLDFADAHGRTQRLAIERLAGGGRFGVVVGTAGAGKTALLTPLVTAWKDQGREVLGASLAWRQADDLTQAGIDPANVKAFSVLIDGLKGGTLLVAPIHADQNTVIAVDELGMLGTRQGLELLRLREKHGFSIVALGDDKQCSSIESGAIVGLSRRALGPDQVPEILTTRRQQTEREREIVGLFREGRSGEALDMKRADGTAEMTFGGRDGVIKRVREIYLERLQATGEAPTISAPTNTDAHQISEGIRGEKRKLGMIGADSLQVSATDGEREYQLKLAKGDRVRLFQSTRAELLGGSRKAIGRNGSVLEVVAASVASGLVLRNADGLVGTVRWKDITVKHSGRVLLAYGDATTIHAAQGLTSNEHILALPSGSQAVTGGQAYSAGTRHRQVAYIVTSEVAERLAVRNSRPLNDSNEITLADKWANVAKQMVTQTKVDSALALFDRLSTIRRGAVKEYQHSLRPDAPRRQRMGPGQSAPQIVQQQKVDRSIRVVAQQVVQQVEQVMQQSKRKAREIGRGLRM